MFKKLLAATMVVSVAASMSVSAFAADVTVAPTDSAVTVTPTAVENATMYTVMVFSCAADADVATATPADASAIYYINQGTELSTLVTNMLVKATSETEYLPAGNYVVRIGNDTGSVQNFTLESKIVEDVTTIKIKFCDVNGDGVVDGNDAGFIAAYSTGASAEVSGGKCAIGASIIVNGTELKFCDANGDNVVDGNDAGFVAAYSTGATGEITGGKCVIGVEYDTQIK